MLPVIVQFRKWDSASGTQKGFPCFSWHIQDAQEKYTSTLLLRFKYLITKIIIDVAMVPKDAAFDVNEKNCPSAAQA